jgi:hypothetical protein
LFYRQFGAGGYSGTFTGSGQKLTTQAQSILFTQIKETVAFEYGQNVYSSIEDAIYHAVVPMGKLPNVFPGQLRNHAANLRAISQDFDSVHKFLGKRSSHKRTSKGDRGKFENRSFLNLPLGRINHISQV